MFGQLSLFFLVELKVGTKVSGSMLQRAPWEG